MHEAGREASAEEATRNRGDVLVSEVVRVALYAHMAVLVVVALWLLIVLTAEAWARGGGWQWRAVSLFVWSLTATLAAAVWTGALS